MSQDQLDALVPTPDEVTIKGETIKILPIRVGKLPAFIRAVSPFIHVFKDSPDKVDYLALFEQHGDSVLDACALGSGKDRSWVDDLDMAELVLVAQAVVAANMDFFIQRFAPVLAQAVAKLSSLRGATSSRG